MRHIGIFGGTFNPIHTGHLKIAQKTQKIFQLDKIIFIPAFIPPHKKEDKWIIDAKYRLAMTNLAIKKIKTYEISDIEIKKTGVSYTYDTVLLLKKKYKDDKLYLLIGSDSLAEMNQWHRYKDLIRIIEFIVYIRPGFENIPTEFKDEPLLHIIRDKMIDISSSMIRELIKSGRSARKYLDPVVLNYIKKNDLYR